MLRLRSPHPSSVPWTQASLPVPVVLATQATASANPSLHIRVSVPCMKWAGAAGPRVSSRSGSSPHWAPRPPCGLAWMWKLRALRSPRPPASGPCVGRWRRQSQQQDPEASGRPYLWRCFPGGGCTPAGWKLSPRLIARGSQTFLGPWAPGILVGGPGKRPALAPTRPTLSPLMPLVTALFLWQHIQGCSHSTPRPSG